MVKKDKAIFFDRDGVLIKAPIDKDYKPISINNFRQIEYVNYIEEIVSKFRKTYFLIMITNQPDVSRKKNTLENVKKINNTIKNYLNLDEVFVCYCDTDNCPNRKPNPGMLLKAQKQFSINLNVSYFIGDRWRDIGAAKRAECNSILIDYHYREKMIHKPDFIIKNLKEVEKIIS